jgi:hypothetical protein
MGTRGCLSGSLCVEWTKKRGSAVGRVGDGVERRVWWAWSVYYYHSAVSALRIQRVERAEIITTDADGQTGALALLLSCSCCLPIYLIQGSVSTGSFRC